MSKSLTKELQTDLESSDLQVVAWKLGEELYGMNIAVIFTVITVQPITPVPQTAPYLKGVMNLRGHIIPVIDLRMRFGMPPCEETSETRIVVINVDSLEAGLIVDSVSEVLRIPESNIEQPNQWIASTGNKAIVGIGKIPASALGDSNQTDRLVILVDPIEVLTGVSSEVKAVEAPAA